MSKPTGKPPAFQLYAKEWLSSERVRLLGPYGRGVFVDLLAYDWDRGGYEISGVPNDPESVAALVGVPVDEVRRIWSRLIACYVPHPTDPARMVCEKLERVRAEMKAYSARQSAAGKGGNEVRYQRRRARARHTKDLDGLAAATERRSSGDRSAPASALTPTSTPKPDLDLREISDLEPVPRLEERREEQVAGEQVKPSPELESTIATLFAEKRALPALSTSVPTYDRDEQYDLVHRFLLAHYRPDRIGAGAPACVNVWMSTVDMQDAAIAVRELPRQDYKGRAWQDLSDDERRGIIGWTFNALGRRANGRLTKSREGI